MRKRITALFLMVLMICTGVLIGSRRSLDKLREETDQVFFSGVLNDGYSIQSDLDKIIADSYNLYTVSKNYIGETDLLITGLLSARDELNKALTPSEKFKANEKLLEAVTSLYFKNREASALTESHANLAAQFYTEILSRNSTIKNDGYNDAARKYNAVLKSFPASLIAPLAGVKPVELFASD